ncbi:MAG: hypothetical protein ACJAYG_000387 [Oceanicoccus sp.]|jgi:hypothetical protein
MADLYKVGVTSEVAMANVCSHCGMDLRLHIQRLARRCEFFVSKIASRG